MQRTDGKKRERVFHFSNCSITAPTLWFGHDLKQGVKVWEHLGNCPGILLNAYHLIKIKPKVREKMSVLGIGKTLSFSGPIFLDSGGFQAQKDGKSKLQPKEVLSLCSELNPDLMAVLDVPLSPLRSNRTNSRRWKKTLENTALMYRNCDKVELCPVIHSYSLVSLRRKYMQLMEIYPAPKVVCIGSLVPLLQGRYIGDSYQKRNGSLSAELARWTFVSKLILQIRAMYPEAMLHVFGAGSLSTMYLLFLLGVDSVDSCSWRLKAAFGEIQLPGLSNRCITNVCRGNHTRRKLTPDELSLLEKCDCTVCRDTSIGMRIKRLASSYAARSIHNAHVFVSEIEQIKLAFERKALKELVYQRLETSQRFLNILLSVVIKEIEPG